MESRLLVGLLTFNSITVALCGNYCYIYGSYKYCTNGCCVNSCCYGTSTVSSIGIAFGVISFIVIVCVILACWCRRHRSQQGAVVSLHPTQPAITTIQTGHQFAMQPIQQSQTQHPFIQQQQQQQQHQQHYLHQTNQYWQQQQQPHQQQQQQQQPYQQSWPNPKPEAPSYEEQPPLYTPLASTSTPSSEYNHQPLSPKTLTPSTGSTHYYYADVDNQNSGYEQAYETPSGRSNQTNDDSVYEELR